MEGQVDPIRFLLDQGEPGQVLFARIALAGEPVPFTVLLVREDGARTDALPAEPQVSMRAGLIEEAGVPVVAVSVRISDLTYDIWLNYHDEDDRKTLEDLKLQDRLAFAFVVDQEQPRRIVYAPNALSGFISSVIPQLAQRPGWNADAFAGSVAAVRARFPDARSLWENLPEAAGAYEAAPPPPPGAAPPPLGPPPGAAPPQPPPVQQPPRFVPPPHMPPGPQGYVPPGPPGYVPPGPPSQGPPPGPPPPGLPPGYIPPGPPGYFLPQYGPPPGPPPPIGPQTSGMAIASLVLSLLGFFCLCIFGSIPAIILGHIARSRIKKNPESLSGGGLALAGLIIGYVQLALTIAAIPLIVIGAIEGQQDETKISLMKTDLRNAAAAEESYYADSGTYTSSLDTLKREGFKSSSDQVTISVAKANTFEYCIDARYSGYFIDYHIHSYGNRGPEIGTC